MQRLCFVMTFVCSLAFLDRADADRYCGIYAVFGAASCLGHQPDFESLIGKEYVSGYAGSTTNDLLEAIEFLGLHGTPVWRLSAASLKKTSDPLVLHVSSEGQLISYNHWLLFLGQKNGMAQIAEGEQGVVWVPLANVLARWDGVAIAVHQNQQPNTNFDLAESRQRIAWLLLAAILVGPFAFLRLSESRRLPILVIGICGVTALAGALRHSFAPDGFFHNKRTLAYIDAAFSGGKFRLVSMEQIKQAFANDDPLPYTIIDARYEGDFQLGAIPGAINIPISANSGMIRNITRDIDKEKPVVVYCQSSSCSFDRVVAILLAGQGFRDIRLCSDGWVDWVETEETQP